MKIISLNINKGRPNLDRQISFLRGQGAGLIFLQEVLEYQVAIFKKQLGCEAYWGQMSQSYDLGEGLRGNLILSAKPLTSVCVHDLGSFDQERIRSSRYENLNISLVSGYCEDLGCVVACTHLPWSETSEVDGVQCKALGQLNMKIVDERLALIGLDVNSARVLPNGLEGEIWRDLSSVLTDGVPLEIESTIDPEHHWLNNGPIKVKNVIDGLFFNPRVVKVVSLTKSTGLSDHCALVAYVEAVNAK